ncbi:hypothetical protein ON010_g856 [Phytophthora cinnamomi]|nr:hypothetical protein ON010_g856 [Phytophthora cinnamomi]
MAALSTSDFLDLLGDDSPTEASDVALDAVLKHALDDPKARKRAKHRAIMVEFRQNKKEKQKQLEAEHLRLERQMKSLVDSVRPASTSRCSVCVERSSVLEQHAQSINCGVNHGAGAGGLRRRGVRRQVQRAQPHRAPAVPHQDVPVAAGRGAARAAARAQGQSEHGTASANRLLCYLWVQMGHNDLGDFYYELGDLPAALKSFAQARDYCTTDKHIIEMCLNVSKVALHMRNFGHVTNYLSKLEQVNASQSDPILKSKIASAFGLVALNEKNYHAAASKFIECNAEIGASYNEVLHAEDIALYGGICALASFKREELKEKVGTTVHFLFYFHTGKHSFLCVLLTGDQQLVVQGVFRAASVAA